MIEELEALKKKLPIGFTRILAEEFNVSRTTVSQALQGKGKHRHYDIINRAIEIAQETTKKTNEIEKKLKKQLKK